MIFESMNDRLNPTSTEMLKGYVLSRFSDAVTERRQMHFGRRRCKICMGMRRTRISSFSSMVAFPTCTIRAGKVGHRTRILRRSERFHSWVEITWQDGLDANRPDGFRELVNIDLNFSRSMKPSSRHEKPG